MITGLLFAVALLGAQEKPTLVAKLELPKSEVDSFCGTSGAIEHERANFGVRYKGKVYYFCDKPALDAFLKDPDGFIPPPVPRQAPSVSMSALDGKMVTLNDYKGKVVLVDFWATWCKPCVENMPHLNKLQAEFAAKNFTVLGVSIDQEGAKKVAPFLAKHKLSYPIVLDNGKNPAWQAFRVKGVPAVYLVDANGTVVAQWGGGENNKDIEATVRNLLK